MRFNSKLKIILIILHLLLLLDLSISFSQGLSVSPSKLHFKNVSVGKRFQFSTPITVTNKSKELTSYTIRAILPSKAGVIVDKGFKELPSKDWVSFEKKHIATNPLESVIINMFIEIPEKAEYINKDWEFLVSVEEHFKPSSMFNIVCDVKIFVSTHK